MDLTAAPTRRLLLISGSTRAASSNSALVRTAAALASEMSIDATVYDGLARLPHFNPDDDADPLPSEVAALRLAIATADAVLICTPEYAGTLPGSMKNLLDWTVGGTEFTGKRVAWVNAAADERRGHGAIATLVTVLGYVQTEIVESACRHVPVTPTSLADETTRTRLREVIETLLGSVA